MKKTFAAVLATLILTLAVGAPAAFAQSSQDGYIQEGPSVVDQTSGNDPDDGSDSGGDPNSTSSVAGDELPFTGLDLGLVAVAGASLMVLGVGMRRLTRAPDSV